MVIHIPLSKTGKHAGKFEAIIDDCDSDLEEVSWNVKIRKNRNTNYVARGVNLGKAANYKIQEIKMHRVILERMIGRPLEKDEFPDHIDGNGLRNTRDNLRLATFTQNVRNSKKQKNKICEYKGVTYESGRWRARIRVNGKLISLGLFNNPEEAHEAYKKAAIEHFGEFARFE